MQITVKGKQLDVGDALRSHITDTLIGHIGKYFANPLDATVVLSRDAHLYTADIQVHVGRGILLQAAAAATEPYPAFDEAAERVAKRARRHKRRLKDHHRAPDPAADPPFESPPARKYILEGYDDSDEGEPSADAAIGMDSENQGGPVVVAEMELTIPHLTVGEAVMRLDLTDLPALMFRNRAHGGLNMVYRRPDGNVGWVDPGAEARSSNGPAAGGKGAGS